MHRRDRREGKLRTVGEWTDLIRSEACFLVGHPSFHESLTRHRANAEMIAEMICITICVQVFTIWDQYNRSIRLQIILRIEKEIEGDGADGREVKFAGRREILSHALGSFHRRQSFNM
jgi:hypothetical protein